MESLFYLDKKILKLEQDLKYKNDESLKKLCQLIEHITYLAMVNEITLEQLESYSYKLFLLNKSLQQ